MNRSIRAAGVLGVMVAGLAGCDLMPRNSQQTAVALVDAVAPALTFTALATDGHVYYSASVDATSVSLQQLLTTLGLPVSVSKDPNGTVRIASATPDGSHFTLVLRSTGLPGGNSSRTNVLIEWDGTTDSRKGIQVLVDLETQKRGKAPSNTSAVQQASHS